MYLTLHNFDSALNAALVTRPENFPTLFHPTLAMSEANAARLQVQQSHLPRILHSARRRQPQPLVSQRLGRHVNPHHCRLGIHTTRHLMKCLLLRKLSRPVVPFPTPTAPSIRQLNGLLKTRSTMAGTGVATSCCNDTRFASCIIQLVETIGVILLPQLGLVRRGFAIGNQPIRNVMATDSEWITFIF